VWNCGGLLHAGGITLDVTPGINILVAEDADQFTESVLQLLDNPQYRDEVGRAGYICA